MTQWLVGFRSTQGRRSRMPLKTIQDTKNDESYAERPRS